MKILLLAMHIMFFVAWLFCMASWMRRGAKFPHWVHGMAIVFVVLGVVATGVAYASQALSGKLALSCLLLPPAFAYGAWLWLFGPAHQKNIHNA